MKSYKSYIKLLIFIAILAYNSICYANPNSQISIPNTAVANTVISSSSYNQNNNEIQTKFNSHSHIDISQLSTITTGIWAATPINYAFLSLTSSVTTLDLAPATITYLVEQSQVPSGTIVMWHGSIASIPTGWYLCNGSNGTPDLRNRFIVAADADVGGVAMSTITGSATFFSDTGVIPAHTHTTQYGSTAAGTLYPEEPYTSDSNAGSSQNTGSTGTGTKVISVFYSLSYIMKS